MKYFGTIVYKIKGYSPKTSVINLITYKLRQVSIHANQHIYIDVIYVNR